MSNPTSGFSKSFLLTPVLGSWICYSCKIRVYCSKIFSSDGETLKTTTVFVLLIIGNGVFDIHPIKLAYLKDFTKKGA